MPSSRRSRAALAAGKPVVTANKALLAKQLAALGVLAQRTETPLLCEAAAAAALPIIRHLSHRADEVDSLMAIVNGTCNFVITRLEQDELHARSRDRRGAGARARRGRSVGGIDGHDAAAKLSILAYRAFGAWVPPDQLPVRGIGELWPADCDLAESMGFRIRLIAHAARIGGALTGGGRAAAAARLAPARVRRGGVQRGVPEDRVVGRPVAVRQGRRRAADRDRGARRSDRSRAGQLGAVARAARRARSPLPPPRRHYVRVTAEPHPGLVRRVEASCAAPASPCRTAPRAASPLVTHHGFLISPSDDATIAALVEQLRELGRVEQTLWLGVAE